MNLLHVFLGEFFGTAVLIFLGNGVVANANFKKTLGHGGGLIAIAFGWALGVFAGVSISNIWQAGGYINPAVTIGNLAFGKITIVTSIVYLASQLSGGLFGQIVVNTLYWQHIKEERMDTVLGMHSTGPTHKNAVFTNLFSEFFATLILVSIVFLSLNNNANWFGGAPLAVSLVVLGIGLSLGGTTGYAINPARDLSPRIVHWFMYKLLRNQFNLKDQVITSNWKYSWVPIVAPVAAGAIIGGLARVV